MHPRLVKGWFAPLETASQVFVVFALQFFPRGTEDTIAAAWTAEENLSVPEIDTDWLLNAFLW